MTAGWMRAFAGGLLLLAQALPILALAGPAEAASAGLHVEPEPRLGAGLRIGDGAHALLTLGPQLNAAGGALKPSDVRTERLPNGGLRFSRAYDVAQGGHARLDATVIPMSDGSLNVTLTLRSSVALAAWTTPTFTPQEGVRPFRLRGPPAAEASYDSPAGENKASPLPVLGVEAAGRAWFVAAGASWDQPLEGYTEPHLAIREAGLAAPLVGEASHPVRLAPGVTRTWHTFVGRAPIYDPTAPGQRDYATALGAQLAVADAVGARASRPPPVGGPRLREEARARFGDIAFATAYWARVTAVDGRRSVTPAPHYSPGTWMRDSFWTVLGLGGSPLEGDSERVLMAAYAAATPRDGAFAGRVPLLLAQPSTIAFDDESGLYFLIRMDRDAHDLRLPVADRPLASLVLSYILRRQTDGARFVTAGPEPFRERPFSPNGWLDGYAYPRGEVITANQGLFVLALKAAAHLGVDVPPGLIERALAQYRTSYDPRLGYMRWLSGKAYRSPDVLIPEALSLLLWDAPLLDDRAVRDTLVAQRWSPYGMRVLVDEGGGAVDEREFLNTTNDGRPREPAGWYQNGGSWLLWEYLAEYAARRHGDPTACGLIGRSLDAELAVEPISKEFKLTGVAPTLEAADPGGARILGSTDPERQGYGWNAAIRAFQADLRRRGLACD